MDWSWLVGFDVSPWQLVARGTLMYWFLFLVFRFLLRRDVGGLGVADVLLVVLVADASQNAMTASYHSVAKGLVLVSTLIGWNYLLDLLAFHFPTVERFVEARPLPLIRRGRVIHKNVRAEYITMDELWSHLRQNGIESLGQVKSACLEGDGQMSVVRSGSAATAPKAKSRTPRAAVRYDMHFFDDQEPRTCPRPLVRKHGSFGSLEAHIVDRQRRPPSRMSARSTATANMGSAVDELSAEGVVIPGAPGIAWSRSTTSTISGFVSAGTQCSVRSEALSSLVASMALESWPRA